MKHKTRFWKTLFPIAAVLIMVCSLAFAQEAPAAPQEIPVTEINVNGFVLMYQHLLPETVTSENHETLPNAYQFYLTMRKGELTVPLFSLDVMDDSGDMAVVLKDEQGNYVPVSIFLAAAPQDLTQNEQEQFTVAQETARDILMTLKLVTVPENPETTDPKPVVVETEKYTLSYPARYADTLLTREEADGSLVFFIRDGEKEITSFTLVPDSDQGNIVVMLKDEAEAKHPAAIVVAAMPEDLSPQAQAAFLDSQGAIGEVMNSLALK
ncbi:MAG: hypothetical protein E7319_04695 [Clostridiales bacterium]|nr:hypothetical protein [Clostridiales bacterium]